MADDTRPGFLSRLAHDRKGNTLAMMAAAVIPLAGLVGGAVDGARLYLTKTRLQQACDAGALAGRKVMGGGQWSANNNAARTAALEFFDANFENGAYGTGPRTRDFTENAGRVHGTASTTVPMTIMRIFKDGPTTITVSCDAEMRLPNTDVMFVLDTTYSMTETIPGDNKDKIDGLKSAVKCFYEILAKRNTSENCPNGGNQTSGVGGQVQIRFGFVPYATNVNVGKLLPTNFIADSWTYSSREAHLEPKNVPLTWSEQPYVAGQSNISVSGSNSSWKNEGSPVNADRRGNCPSAPGYDYSWTGSPTLTGQNGPTQSGNNQVYTKSYQQSGVRNQYQYVKTNGKCQLQKRTRPATQTWTETRTDTPATWTTIMVPNGRWSYKDVTFDISGLKNGTTWNSSIQLPLNMSGNSGNYTVTDKTVTWDGCIEERRTIADPTTSEFATMFSGNYDLNIDLVPNAGNPDTLWGPMLNGAVYVRPDHAERINSNTNYSNPSTGSIGDYTCPTEARKLQEWNDPNQFTNYVNSLTPAGYTYHDIGLLWGARFISPTGIFASENAFTAQGGEIERHLIFMTDGEACSKSNIYQAYGVATIRRNNPNFANKRMTNQDVSNTSYRCSTNNDGGGPLTQEIVDRYEKICTAVKNKNITLWVIYFGNASSDDRTRMENCATDNRFYQATSNAALMTTFATIAAQISQLRLTS